MVADPPGVLSDPVAVKAVEALAAVGVASVAEAAGAKVPENALLDGTSFLSQLRGEEGRPRKWIYCQKGSEWFIRTKQFRLRNNGSLHYMKDRYKAKLVEVETSPRGAAIKERLEAHVKALRKE